MASLHRHGLVLEYVSPRVISNLLGAQSVSIPNDRGLNDMWLIFGALFAADTRSTGPQFF